MFSEGERAAWPIAPILMCRAFGAAKGFAAKGFLVYREPIRLCLNHQCGIQQCKPLHDAEVIVVG